MSVPGPVLGPCESWIDGDAVAACCATSVDGLGSDAVAVLQQAAVEASMVLYEISGRQFNGLCTALSRRPCSSGDACWGVPGIGAISPWFWGGGYGYGGWGWRNENGPHCGCSALSEVKLPGYPVREITEVKIDGQVLDALDANGNRNYRIDGYDTLVRMDDPGPPLVRRCWPSCQNMALDDDQPGTFSVSYRWGVDPPELGRRAAAQIACQLILACPDVAGDGECLLPDGLVTRVERQGITIDSEGLAGFFDPKKPTGLISVDLFMRGYAQTPGTRPPAVWSPGVQPYARRTG